MKNFRKVLALILVVATLFSFVAMTSAKEYTDAEKINYDQAVDVLSAIGILEGYPDGSFKPADNIAREEMAKMVAVLSNAGDDVSELYASACKFGDTKDRWSASYVAYCNETGIVAGRNASTFDPRGKVTGIETAKMLLCLLGFDATAQGYVGTNWKTNVLRDAKNMGLLDGFAADYDAAKAITREEAANMMLNALRANIVIGTISDNIVKISNSAYNKYNNWTLIDAKKEGFRIYGNAVISNDPLYTIYGTLTVKPGSDCYGNPGETWTFTKPNGTVLFQKTYTVGATFSDTKSVKLQSVLSEEIKADAKAKHHYSLTVLVDGELYRSWTNVSDVTTNDWTDLNGLTGKGVLTNVFVTEDHSYDDDGDAVVEGVITVTIKNTFIDKVVDTSYANSKFELAYGAYGDTVFDNSKYGFKEGDVVLFWMCKKGLYDAKLATPVTTDVKRVTYKESSFGTAAADAYLSATATAKDGKSYEYALNLFNVNDFDAENNRGKSVITVTTGTGTQGSYDLYLDEYGYIIAWIPTAANVETGVGYYVPNSLKSSGSGHYEDGDWVMDFTATFVNFEGKTETLTLNDTKPTGDIAKLMDIDKVTNVRDGYGALVTYVKKGDKIDLAYVDGINSVIDYDGTYVAAGNTGFGQSAGNGKDETYYLSKKGSIVNYETGKVWMDGTPSTKYLVKTGDTYSVYNYNELPSAFYPKNGAEYGLQFFTSKTASGQHEFLSYVFVDARYTLTDAHAYVSGYDMTVSDSDWSNLLPNYAGFKAIINGKPGIFAVSNEVAGDLDLYDTFTVVEARLEFIGITDGAEKLPIYAAVDKADVDIVASHKMEITTDGTALILKNGATSTGSTTLPISKDCIFAVAKHPYKDGAWDAYDVAVVDLEEFMNIVADDQSAIDGAYTINVGWYYTDANGAVTEIYVNTGNYVDRT